MKVAIGNPKGIGAFVDSGMGQNNVISPPQVEFDQYWTLADVTGDGRNDLIAIGKVGAIDQGVLSVSYATDQGFGDWDWISSVNNIVLPLEVLIAKSFKFADVSGDGKVDLVLISGPGAADQGKVKVALGNGIGFDPISWQSDGKNIGFTVQTLNAGSWDLADISGDGKADLFAISGPGAPNQGRIHVSFSTGAGFGNWDWNSSGKNTNFSIYTLNSKCWTLADVNGDGKKDLVAVGGIGAADQGRVYITFSTGTGFGNWDWTSNGKNTQLSSQTISSNSWTVSDVTGDGKADLIGIGGPGQAEQGRIVISYAYSNSLVQGGFGDWNFDSYGKPTIIARETLENGCWAVADVTGDNKADFISIGAPGTENEGVISISHSTGSGYDTWDWNSAADGITLPADTITARAWAFSRISGENSSDLFAIMPSDVPNAGSALVSKSEHKVLYDWSSEQDLDGPVFSKETTGKKAWTLADANGDGRDDLIYIGGADSLYQGVIFISYGTPDGFRDWDWNSAKHNFLLAPDKSDPLYWSFADITGDGKADLMAVSGPTAPDQGRIYVSHGTEDGYKSWNWISYGKDINFTPETIQAHTWSLADINGDGRADLFAITGPGALAQGRVHVSFSTGIGFGNWDWKSIGYNTNFRVESLYAGAWSLADVSGDGKADLIGIGGVKTSDQGVVYVSFSTGNGFGNWDWNNAGLGSVFTKETIEAHSWSLADVNGDGKTDLIGIGGPKAGDQGRVYVSFSTGHGFGSWDWFDSAANSNYTLETVNADSWSFADVNGDGMADMIAIGGPDTEDEGVVNVAYSTGRGFQNWNRNNSSKDSRLNKLTVTERNWSLADVNGDGNADLVAIIRYTANDPGRLYFTPSLSQPAVITQVKNPSGGTTSIAYVPASVVPDAIDPSQSLYPKVANTSPRSLAVEITQDDGFGSVIRTQYGYQNALRISGILPDHKDLGFQKVVKTTLIADTQGEKTVTTYLQDPPLNGLVSNVVTYGHSDEKLLEAVNQYGISTSNLPSGVSFIYPTEVLSKRWDGQSTSYDTKTTYDSYDAYGNCTSETYLGRVNDAGEDIAQTDNSTKATIFSTIVSPRYLSQAQSSQESRADANGQMGIASSTRYYYDGFVSLGTIDKGLVTRIERDITSTSFVVEHFEYDAYGNQVRYKSPRAFVKGWNWTKQTVYDDDYHKYVISTTNINGDVDSRINYDALMRPTETIDINGFSTRMAYDEFGRLTALASPTETLADPTQILEYQDTAFPRSTRLKLKDGSSSYLESISYFDGLNRTLQTKAENRAGQWTTVDQYYDESGRSLKTSIPYLTGTSEFTPLSDSVPYTKVEYDGLGRLIKKTNTDTSFSEVVYKGAETFSIDENRHVTSVETQENVSYSKRYSGTYPYISLYSTATTKTFRGSTVILDNDGNPLVSEYDMLGRRTALESLDMGRWTFTYDADGNIETQIDAKNILTRYEYDKLNRITKIDYPNDADTVYVYDQALGQGEQAYKGKLTSLTYARGSEQYVYDKKGRLNSTSKTLDGITRAISQTYDSMDRLQSMIYPDNETLTYDYGVDGQLARLSGAIVLLDSISYAPDAKILSMVLGNGVTTSYDYYDTASEVDPVSGLHNSNRLKSIIANPLTGPAILDLSYGYDLRDNIKVRTDNVLSVYSETYSYDDHDRLINASSFALGSLTYGYDDIDNILMKEGTSYSYNPSRPHAVSSFGAITYAYDANGSMTSSSDGRTVAYDEANRVRAMNDETYSYDSAFQRTIKESGTKKTLYFFPGYVEEYDNGTLIDSVTYYSANNQRIAQKSSTEGLAFIHTDHLGSSSVLSDETGTVVRRQGYKPYGGDSYVSGSEKARYQYTGQEKDGTGVYYYNARYYDQEIGRFISVDPGIRRGISLRIIELTNAFSYCQNNPVLFLDPTGMIPKIQYDNCVASGIPVYLLDSYAGKIEPIKQTEMPGGQAACAYRASQNVSENFVDECLSLDQIEGSRDDLVGQNLVNEQYGTFGNYLSIVDNAFDVLNQPEYFGVRVATAENADASIRLVNDSSGDPTGHTQRGGGDGGFGWDPYFGGNDPNRNVAEDGTIYIDIRKEVTREVMVYGPNGPHDEVRTYDVDVDVCNSSEE